MRGRLLPLALALLAVSLPLGAAEWGMRGSWEPDTAEDRAGGFMFADPDHSGSTSARQVYFNGWAGNGGAAMLSLNPNSAALGTSILQAPYRAYALLGIWKDCNADGYLGLGDNLLFEYRSALLTRDDICPAVAGTDPLRHNDGEWVREFFPIGPDSGNDTNPHNIADEGALVWADFERPGHAAVPTCPLTPLPHGTTRSTGGALRYVDCQMRWQLTGSVNAVVHLLGQDDLAFDDAPQHRPDKSASPLNQPNPYGDPAGAPAVSAFDCSAPPVVFHDETGLTRPRVPDPTGGALAPVVGGDGELDANLTDEEHDRRIAPVPHADPARMVNPGGSLAGSVNETESATSDCNREEARNCSAAAHVGPDQHTGGDAYCLVEAARASTLAHWRTKVDLPMRFVQGGPRGDLAREQLVAQVGAPDAAGLAPPTRNDWFWVGSEGILYSRNAIVEKDTLGPAPVRYFTHYASMTPATMIAHGLTTPKATLGAYGAEWCSNSEDPLQNGGFVCDPDEWTTVARPGVAYQLRDIDCYDMSAALLRNAGAHYGLLTGTACR